MYSEVSGNGADGISFQVVQVSADFIIQDTTINDNVGNGIYFVEGEDLIIQDTKINDNTGTGINVEKADSVTLKNVDASGNGNDGGENIKINGVLLNIE